jgi:hypothetical protein
VGSLGLPDEPDEEDEDDDVLDGEVAEEAAPDAETPPAAE